ncbi:MAG: ester cyclase [Marinilabiliales bacterium]|nr:ester cyclase [Marinilabiliales bacterium]
MERSDNKEIMRQYVEQVENNGDLSRIEHFIAEEYAEVYEGIRYPVGVQGAIDHVLGVRQVFPDLKLTIEHQIAEGDWVVTCYTASGTFQKEWFGMKPTGQPMVFHGVNVDRFLNGKIIEHGGALNMFDPLLKAGIIEIK